MGIVRKLRAVYRLGPAVHRAGLVALPTLAVIGLSLRTAGYARTSRWLARRTAQVPPIPSTHAQAARDTVAAGLLLAARALPWRPACLERSMALRHLLRRRGYAAEVRIGVRKREGAGGPERGGGLACADEGAQAKGAPAAPPIEAHAWVEVDGEVVGDRADVHERFLPFGDDHRALASELVRLPR